MTTALKNDRRGDARLHTAFPPPGILDGPIGVFGDQEKQHFQERVRLRVTIARLESELSRALAARPEGELDTPEPPAKKPLSRRAARKKKSAR